MPTKADQGTAEDAQQAQAGLAALVIREALAAFDTGKIDDDAIAQLAAVYEALARRYAPASTALAIRQYQRERTAAGIVDSFRPQPAVLPPLGPLRVEWAITQAITPQGVDAEQVVASLANSLARTVQDAGRTTIIANVKRDRVATAWARIPEPELTESGTCSFCAMLCARGAVFKSQTVNFRAHLPKEGRGHVCVCSAQPIFGKYEPSPLVERYQGLWKSAVTDQNRHGKDARAAFRQAVEGREVTGLSGASRARSIAASSPRPVKLSDTDARRVIAGLEASNARIGSQPQYAGLLASNNRRISELRSQLGE